MRKTSELVVNLSHLAHNVQQLKKIAPNNQIIFMVKADAYGHGLKQIVEFAYNEIGIKSFGLACLYEAVYLRRVLPKLECQLYVFSDTEIQDAESRMLYVDYNIFPVLHSLSCLETVLEDKNMDNLPLVLKFDTGMHRIGIREQDTQTVIDLLKKKNRLQIHHLMTHFASSYLLLKENDRTHRQYHQFLEIKSQFHSAGITIKETSCANSGAIEQGFALEESHIRPGLMLYGPRSTQDAKNWPAKIISTLKTKILKIEAVTKGTPIGYGAHVCSDNGYLIYLPLGYGDGMLTFYSGAKFNFEGLAVKVLGRVNMDMMLLFSKTKPEALTVEDPVSLWDEDQDKISELSTQLKTIPYQLFTALSARVPRRYIK